MQFTVIENRPLTPAVFRMTLAGDTRSLTRPGQFVQVQVPGFYLRRPLSVFDWQPAGDGWMTLVYKALGKGTEALSGVAAGASLDVLTGLGNGFQTDMAGAAVAKAPLLIGGGIGVPPLYGLCKALLREGKVPSVILGFNTRQEIILRDDFEALGVKTIVTTMDGSEGARGFVTDAAALLSGAFDYVYACGPEPMLRAVYNLCGREKCGRAVQL